MNKPNLTRKINKNLFYSKLHLFGLSLRTLGERLDPPVSKFRVHQFIWNAAPNYRLREIAANLKTNIQTLWPKEKGAA
jgi:hypothetical protein